MNDTLNRFRYNASSLNMQRSRFKMPFNHKTTITSGQLVPVYCGKVLPGDSFSIDFNSVVRSVTPAVPVMDNAYLDVFAFYVPMRLCTKNANDWQKICGENFDSAWYNQEEATLESTGNTVNLKTGLNMFDQTNLNPKPYSGMRNFILCAPQSVANYLGFPVKDGTADFRDTLNLNVSTLKIGGLVKIWNDWFRDQNVTNPVDWESILNSDPKYMSMFFQNYYNRATAGDNPKAVLPLWPAFSNTLIDSTDGRFISYPFPVAKKHDYFTSALPSPQKGASVYLPLLGAVGASGAPVVTGEPRTIDAENTIPLMGRAPATDGSYNRDVTMGFPTFNSQYNSLRAYNNEIADNEPDALFIPNNLYADIGELTGSTVNEVRMAFAIQNLFEIDARGGTRYREMLLSHFGVHNGDLTLQVPEYLGGQSFPLNVQQVLNTAETEASPLGQVGAFSNTSNSYKLVPGKSFTEFGYVYVLACIRTENNYSKGLNKDWLRNRRFDWYYPALANLGEQPIYNYELAFGSKAFTNPDAGGTSEPVVFGYNEAWADYRFEPNEVTGYFHPGVDNTLTPWTYQAYVDANGDVTLSDEFIYTAPITVAQTLIYSDSPYQFLCDFYLDMDVSRPMPLFSIPGLKSTI